MRTQLEIYTDVVQRVQHEIFELETQGWPLSEIAQENLKLLHKVLGNKTCIIDGVETNVS